MDKELNIQYPKKQPFKIPGRPARINDKNGDHTDITTMAYDPEGKYLAVGSFDGSIKLYNPYTNKISSVLQPPPGAGQEVIPISCLRWRPQWSGENQKPSSVLTSIHSDGLIQNWHLSTNKIMNDITQHQEWEHNLLCGDYTWNGKQLAVAGCDRHIYLYDQQSRELISKMHSRGIKVSGHQNRIFVIKAHPTDENVLLTGSWDGSVKFYDVRVRGPVASLGGALLCGDSLDIYDDMIVTGSNRNRQEMCTYSYSQRKRVHTWEFSQNKDVEAGYVFTTKFSNDGNFIFAGGAGKNEFKVFANNGDSAATYKLQMEIKDLPDPIYQISAHPVIKQFAFGLGNGQIYMCNYDVETNLAEYEPYNNDFQRVAKEQIRQEEERKLRRRQGLPASGLGMQSQSQLAQN